MFQACRPAGRLFYFVLVAIAAAGAASHTPRVGLR
jgi:hypothetical protein